MKNNLNLISVWFSVIIILLVMAGAFSFTFTDFMKDKVFGSKRIILTIIFIGYSIYRSIRIYQIFKSGKNGG